MGVGFLLSRKAVVCIQNIFMELGVELGDGDTPLHDLGDDEREHVALGDIRQDDVVLTTQVVAIVGQAPKTIS